MSKSIKEHWNKVYASAVVQQLGWYEAEPDISLSLIENCAIDKRDPILDVGAGATTLIDNLLHQNYQNIIALDVSSVALEKLQTRLGTEKTSRVIWLVDDITKPKTVLAQKDIAIWHDRALLHFLIHDEERHAYQNTLNHVLRSGGYVIIAAFAKDGASKCSGLDVRRYDSESLADFLGDGFALKESINYQYQMPSGHLRPYIYGRFQKIV